MLSLLELVLHQYLLPAIQLSEVPPTFAYCFNLLPCVSSASFDSIDEGKKNKIFDTFFVSYLVGRVLYRRKKASLSYFSLFLLFFPFFFIRLWYQWNTVFFLCFHLQAINLPRTHPFEVAGNGPEVPPLCCFSLDARHGTGWNQLLWRTQSVCLLITSDRMTHPNLCVFLNVLNAFSFLLLFGKRNVQQTLHFLFLCFVLPCIFRIYFSFKKGQCIFCSSSVLSNSWSWWNFEKRHY